MKYLITLILSMILMIHLINISHLIIPINLQTPHHSLRKSAILIGLNDPGHKVTQAISLASQQTGLSPELLMALMFTESTFKQNIVSNKNYQGLMQIPWKIYWEDANTLTGARILLEKLSLTKGNIKDALVLYKGWKLHDKKGEYEADKVITLARHLKETL